MDLMALGLWLRGKPGRYFIARKSASENELPLLTPGRLKEITTPRRWTAVSACALHRTAAIRVQREPLRIGAFAFNRLFDPRAEDSSLRRLRPTLLQLPCSVSRIARLLGWRIQAGCKSGVIAGRATTSVAAEVKSR